MLDRYRVYSDRSLFEVCLEPHLTVKGITTTVTGRGKLIKVYTNKNSSFLIVAVHSFVIVVAVTSKQQRAKVYNKIKTSSAD